MADVYKSVLLAYSAEQMFALVERVEDYPQFLPWCSEIQVHERRENQLTASLMINYRGVKQVFTTTNVHIPSESMQMRLLDGPFKSLDGRWNFKKLRADGCKVEFNLSYEFSSSLLEQVVGPVFSFISNSLVDSFCKQADKVYGKQNQ
jgi:ribosome-associated toxin RatA of RatAB toxin-antitoxin module